MNKQIVIFFSIPTLFIYLYKNLGSNTSGLADQSLEMSTVTSVGGSSHAISRFPPQYSEIVSDFDRNISATTSMMKVPG